MAGAISPSYGQPTVHDIAPRTRMPFSSAAATTGAKRSMLSAMEQLMFFWLKASLAAPNTTISSGHSSRGAMSCTVGCPYEGEIAPAKVGYLAQLMKGIGVQRVDVADTIGVGTPRKVQAAMEATLAHFDVDAISGHFHDTYGQALVNTLAALELGVWNFQSSSAGLGGCPYAKGATGNVATEDVVYMLHGMGIATGIDLDKLIDAGVYISEALGREPNSRASKALRTKRAG